MEWFSFWITSVLLTDSLPTRLLFRTAVVSSASPLLSVFPISGGPFILFITSVPFGRCWFVFLMISLREISGTAAFPLLYFFASVLAIGKPGDARGIIVNILGFNLTYLNLKDMIPVLWVQNF